METLVATLNQEIKSRIGSGIRAEFMGIAETAIIRKTNQETAIPALIQATGEARPTFYDDRLDLTIYHRIANKTYEATRAAGYGDAPTTNAIYEMSIIACGKRSRINPYTLERTLTKAISELKAQGYTLTPIRSDFDRMRTWSQEYSGLPFPLELPIFLFKTTYKVQQRQTPCN